jgi:hypothetical protein
MRVCAVDLDSFSWASPKNEDDFRAWWDAGIGSAVVDEIKKWAYDGWVVAILTSRHRDLRALTEMWLTQKEIPYSTLLVDVGLEQWAELCNNLDAAFFVTEDPYKAEEAAKVSRSYLVKKPYKEGLYGDSVQVVTSIATVTEKERAQ